MPDTGAPVAIALSAEQLGESGSSGESDEEPIVSDRSILKSAVPEVPIRDVVHVKEVIDDMKKDTIRPIEGPKIDPSMLRVMGVKEEDPQNVQRDGQVPTIYDIDIDQLEDKPWRKPDADITDWFNYGFTEETWREYCKAQVRMRLHLYPHGQKSSLISRPIPKERTLNMKPVTQRPKSQANSYMKPSPSKPAQVRRVNPAPATKREPRPVTRPPVTVPRPPVARPPVPRPAVRPAPRPAWKPPASNSRPPPANVPKLPGVAGPLPDIQSLLPNWSSLANQLPAGMPKLPPLIEKLLAGQGKEDDRSRRRRSRSRDRRRRRRRRSRSPRSRSRSKDRDKKRGRD